MFSFIGLSPSLLATPAQAALTVNAPAEPLAEATEAEVTDDASTAKDEPAAESRPDPEATEEPADTESAPADPTTDTAAPQAPKDEANSGSQASESPTPQDEPKTFGRLGSVAIAAIGDGTLSVDLAQTTGTGPFDADDTPGNDSGDSNDIIRTNDTITYRVGVRYEGEDQTNPVIKFTLPQGQELVAMPPFCLAGSNVTPATLPDPEVPLTATSYQSLPTQTVECRVADQPAGTALNYEFLARVRPEMPHGTVMDPVTASATSDQVTDPASSDPVTQTVSAKPAFDLSKQLRNVIAGNVACAWDATKPCHQMTYPITIDVAGGGKGIAPLQSPIVFQDDLTLASYYGPEVAAAMIAEAGSEEAANEAYAPRVVGCGTPVSGGVAQTMPLTRPTGSSTHRNSVRESGDFFCSGEVGELVTVTLTGTDTSAVTVPTTTGSGAALPADTGFVVSALLIVNFPSEVVSKFGFEQSPGVYRLATHNEFKNVQMTGIDGTTVIDDPANNTADYNVIVRANPGSIGKYFSGIWGQRGNTSSSDFGRSVQGPPGSNKVSDGQTQVMAGQAVQSVVALGGSVPVGSGPEFPWTAVACDLWDPSRLTLAAHPEWVGGPGGTYPSNGEPVWPIETRNVSNVKFEYSVGAAGPGAASDCSTGTWVTDPSELVSSTVDDQGRTLWPGINRVRITYSSDIPGGGLEGRATLRVAIGQVVQETDQTTPIPNWASQMRVNGLKTTEEVIADQGRVNSVPTYDPATHIGSLGDRLLLGDAVVRIRKEAMNPFTGEFTSTTVPQYSASDVVKYRLRPTLTAPIVADGVTRQVTVEDCLPLHQRFQSSTQDGNALAPDLVQMGAPDDSDLACATNRQFVRWDLGVLPVAEPIEPIIVDAEILAIARNGVYSNDVMVSSPGDNSDPSVRSDDVQVQIVTPTGIRIAKWTPQSIVEVNPTDVATPRTLKWTVGFANVDAPHGVSNVDVIDVLPADGVGDSDFEGSLTFTSATVARGTGIDILYTATPVTDLDVDPSDASNGAAGSTVWCSAIGGTPVSGAGTAADCPAAASDVTGLRFLRPGDFDPSDEMAIDIVMTPEGNAGGDVYENVTSGRADGVSQQVGPASRQISIIESSVGDVVWEDVNANGIQDAGEPGVPDFPVTIVGEDLDGNPVSLTTTTDADGAYVFEGLASGTYKITFDPNALTSNSTFTQRDAGNDDEVDSDADTTTGETKEFTLGPDSQDMSWDAGLVIDRNVEITIDKTFVGQTPLDDQHRSTVTYDLVVTNSGTAEGEYDLDDQLQFGGNIVVESAKAEISDPEGIVVDAEFDGIENMSIVKGQKLGGGQTHTYRVTVEARVETTITSEERDCTLTSSESGTGFLNHATLTVDSVVSSDTACGEPNQPEIPEQLEDPDEPGEPDGPEETEASDEDSAQDEDSSNDEGVLARAGGPGVWIPVLGALFLLTGFVIVRRRREEHDSTVRHGNV